MNKEEILKMSREENEGRRDEYLRFFNVRLRRFHTRLRAVLREHSGMNRSIERRRWEDADLSPCAPSAQRARTGTVFQPP